jgi:hypothetical protein
VAHEHRRSRCDELPTAVGIQHAFADQTAINIGGLIASRGEADP